MSSIKCPFCLKAKIKFAGNVACPKCDTKFYVEDRLECVFIDLDKNINLPLKGTFCTRCGLVQSDKTASCCLCGFRLCNQVQ